MKKTGRFRNLSKRRKVAAIVSAILVVALAVTGTLAVWYMDDDAQNIWEDEMAPGGGGHDYFDPDDPDDPNKHVFFENFGDVPLIVRIRLYEYMEFTDVAPPVSLVTGTPQPVLGNPRTWTPHIPSNPTQTGAPVHCNAGFHEYWRWVMGNPAGTGPYYYIPTNRNSPPPGNIWETPDFPSATDPGARAIPNATVLTMSEWVRRGMPVGNFWVVDTDGWAYWANRVAPRTATGMLLREVHLDNHPERSFYYGINVRFNATITGGVDANMRPTATPAGNALLDRILGIEREDLDATLADWIARATVEINRANAANVAAPGTYAAADINALVQARDAAIIVRDNTAANDQQKETAIDNIKANYPITGAPSTNLPVNTPSNPTLGFQSIGVIEPDDSDTTQVSVVGGLIVSPARRHATIALKEMLQNPAHVGTATVAAVDPALAPFISVGPNTFGTLGDGERSVIFNWIPLTQAQWDTMVANSSSVTTLGTSGFEGARTVTTDITIASGGMSATVRVTFCFGHSLIIL